MNASTNYSIHQHSWGGVILKDNLTARGINVRQTLSNTYWIIPDPGFQNSMPYLRAALSRKSKTSWLEAIERCKIVSSGKSLHMRVPCLQISFGAIGSLYEMIAVYARRHSALRHTRTHELQPRLTSQRIHPGSMTILTKPFWDRRE